MVSVYGSTHTITLTKYTFPNKCKQIHKQIGQHKNNWWAAHNMTILFTQHSIYTVHTRWKIILIRNALKTQTYTSN